MNTNDRDNDRPGDGLRQLGKYFYQLSIVSYAGLVVTAVINYSNNILTVLSMGATTTLGFGMLGAMYIFIGNNKNKK